MRCKCRRLRKRRRMARLEWGRGGERSRSVPNALCRDGVLVEEQALWPDIVSHHWARIYNEPAERIDKQARLLTALEAQAVLEPPPRLQPQATMQLLVTKHKTGRATGLDRVPAAAPRCLDAAAVGSLHLPLIPTT